MKIAYLLDTFPSTSETFIAREIEALRRRGFLIEVFAFHAGEGATDIPSLLLARALPYQRWRMVGRNLNVSGFDHVHAGWANHLADVARGAANRAKISWSFSAHARDLWVEGGDLKSKLASAKFASSCTLAGVEELRKFGGDVHYVPHGLEVGRYRYEFRKFGLGSEKKLVGVGRLVEKKGWDTAALAAYYTRAKLTIIGDGPMRASLETLPDYFGCTLLPALPHDELIEKLRDFNCFILPSRRTKDGDRDGLANVLLEAAALGLPIITTNAGSASDFVDETTGIVVESSNSIELERAIRRVFDEPEATIERCFNARKRVEERFDADRNVEVLARLFEG